jgi:hypothetical protein
MSRSFFDEDTPVPMTNRWMFLEAKTLYELDVSVNWLNSNGILSDLTYQVAPNGTYTCAFHWKGKAHRIDRFNKNCRCRVEFERKQVVFF